MHIVQAASILQRMQIVESTVISMALLAWVLSKGPYSGLVVFFAMIPFGMMAAVNLPAVGGTSLMAYDLVLLTIGGMLLFRTGIGRDVGQLIKPGRPGWALFLFFCYAFFATMFFPRLFAGETEVFSIGRVAGQIGIVSRPLAPGGGNLSQLVRMMLGLIAFAVPAVVILRLGDHKLVFRTMLTVSVVHAGLGILDILTQATNTSFVMAPIRTANYALTLGQNLGGLDRMIGGFPEASSYGYVALGLFGFWLGYWFHHKGSSRLPMIMVVLFAFLVLRGTSSSAYVGAALLVTLFMALRLREVGASGTGVLDLRVAGALTGIVALLPLVMISLYMLYDFSQGFADFIDRSLLNKLNSDSGVERMSWNIQALRNFSDTWMLGAGLGSVRASNWVAAVLGTTGLIGFVCLVIFLWKLFCISTQNMRPEARHLAMALKMGMAGCMARALVVKATPNLDFVFFAMAGLLTGLAIHAMTQHRPQAESAYA